jgi:hypothetical protein
MLSAQRAGLQQVALHAGRADVRDLERYMVTRMATSDRSPLPPNISASSMLGVCSAPGCGTVVFGRGTCLDHDPPGLHLVDILRDEAVSRGRALSDTSA